MDKLPHAIIKLILSNLLNYIDNKIELKDDIYNYLPKDLRDDFLYALETENYK